MMLDAKQTQYAIKVMGEEYPDALKSTLQADSNFHFLIAVILSAQATDKGVNKIAPALFERFPTPESLAKVTPEEVIPYIKSLGLYQNKAKYLVSCAQKLVSDFGGIVPATRKELVSFPGVGRKTANVVLAECFQVPALAVDTHVQRVAKRLQMVPEKATVLQVEETLMEKLPADLWIKAHIRMIYWGRHRCTAKNPRCATCPLLAMCAFGQSYLDEKS